MGGCFVHALCQPPPPSPPPPHETRAEKPHVWKLGWFPPLLGGGVSWFWECRAQSGGLQRVFWGALCPRTRGGGEKKNRVQSLKAPFGNTSGHPTSAGEAQNSPKSLLRRDGGEPQTVPGRGFCHLVFCPPQVKTHLQAQTLAAVAVGHQHNHEVRGDGGGGWTGRHNLVAPWLRRRRDPAETMLFWPPGI